MRINQSHSSFQIKLQILKPRVLEFSKGGNSCSFLIHSENCLRVIVRLIVGNVFHVENFFWNWENHEIVGGERGSARKFKIRLKQLVYVALFAFCFRMNGLARWMGVVFVRRGTRVQVPASPFVLFSLFFLVFLYVYLFIYFKYYYY